MIDCPNGDVRDVLPEFLHDRLEPRARAAVAAHLESCELCSRELALLTDARTALSATPPINVERIVRALAVPAQPDLRVRALPWAARRRRPWPAFAAAVAAAAGLVTVALSRDVPRQEAGDGQVTTAVGAPSAPESESSLGGAPAWAPSAAPANEGLRNLPELAFAGGVADLSARDLEELIAEIDALEALPAVEPQPVLHALPVAVSGDD